MLKEQGRTLLYKNMKYLGCFYDVMYWYCLGDCDFVGLKNARINSKILCLLTIILYIWWWRTFGPFG